MCQIHLFVVLLKALLETFKAINQGTQYSIWSQELGIWYLV